ncbi:universal stress protein [Nocardia fluminea]|uniref:universal stress protein n=1 Tax=Nocardia fluminea TaxID=134984 RepID=UPI003D11E302
MSASAKQEHRPSTAPIVVGIDVVHGSPIALRWAAEAAALHRRSLLIVHGLDVIELSSSVENSEVITAAIIATIREQASTALRDAARRAREIAPGIPIDTEVSDDSPARLLIDYSETAHMVVLGARVCAGTLAHWGSTLLAVTSHGHGSTVVVRADADSPVRDGGPVVVGIDGSPISEAAIAVAFAEASARGADLVAVHSWSDWDTGVFAGEPALPLGLEELENAETAILAERLAGWQEKYPDVSITRKVFLAGPAEQLTFWSKSAQLVVVGNRGRGGFTGLLLGSTSNFLVQNAHCPVLVAHPG